MYYFQNDFHNFEIYIYVYFNIYENIACELFPSPEEIFFFFKEHLFLNMTTPGQYPGITFHFPISHILLPLTSSPKFLLTAYSLRDIS